MTRSTLFALLIIPLGFAGLSVLPSCKPKPTESEQPATPTTTATPAMSPEMTPASSPEAPANAAPAPTQAAAPANVELKDPVATVNGEPISKGQLEEAFNSAVQASGAKAEDLTAEQKLN